MSRVPHHQLSQQSQRRPRWRRVLLLLMAQRLQARRPLWQPCQQQRRQECQLVSLPCHLRVLLRPQLLS